jgi:hypothetical protein
MLKGRSQKMKRILFKGSEEGQVLGLPMYLIIVMIVAVAVIAAVIFMMPQGTRTMNAQVTDGSVQTGDGSNGEIDIPSGGSFTVTVAVTTNDDRHDPIQGAIVRLVGGHAIDESDPTGADGIATLTVVGAKLDPNVNEAYMRMTVKGSGYEDFEDDQAVLLYRG